MSVSRRLRRVARVGLVALLAAGLAFAGWLWLRDAWWLEASPFGDLALADGVLDAPIGLGEGFEATIASTADGPQLRITHGSQVLWSSVPGRAFVAAARGVADLREARGMAFVEDDITGRCVDQRVHAMLALTPDRPGVIEGTLDCGGTPWPYQVVLAARGDRRLTFDIALAIGDDRAPNRVVLVKQSAPDEGFFGFGAQLTSLDLKGRDVPIVVSEQGIGGGAQPLTDDGAGGRWASSDVAAPWYLTSTLQGFALEEDVISRFDLRRPDAAVVSLLAPRMRGSIFRGDSPLALIEAYTAVVGRMKALPEWAALNREAARRTGRAGSPADSTLSWLGDQLVSRDRHDGLHGALIGLLSGGLSGFSLDTGDIGGDTTIDHPPHDRRSAELHLRWAELAAFTVAFRTDERAQLDDPRAIEHFAAMAGLHRCWMPYRAELMAEAEARGWPVVRAMWLEAPGDPVMRALDRQFMVGRHVVVAPALDPGVPQVDVVLPEGRWRHVWSGQVFEAGRHTVPAPIGQPAAFARVGSAVADQLGRCVDR